MGEARSWMLLGTRCYQGGSNACWPDRTLLGTRRYQASSDGRSAIMDVFRNPIDVTEVEVAAMDAGLIGCFSETDVTRMAARGEARSWMLLGSRCYRGGSRVDAGLFRMRLGTRRCQVGSNGEASSRMLLIMDAPGTRCYQGGSNGCWPDRMLLGTRC